MPSAWMPLLLHPKHHGIPPLLVKYEFGPSDYKISLTDLSYIWSESPDRRQVVRRACNLDTSIDPSEDPAQMGLFLKSIQDALRQRPGTSVNLDESNDIQQLTLHTSTPLPHPLQPLEWSFLLILASQPTFASEFVSPLLSQQLTAKVEKTSLIQQLKEKDNVISNLIDKMQSDGIDLGKVFPGAVLSKSGTGSDVRQVVAKSIKGLVEFNQDQWQRQLAKDNRFPRNLDDLLPQIFEGDGEDTSEGLQASHHGEWWKSVDREYLQRKEATPSILKPDAKQESVVEDEFQRQSTPPKSLAQTPRREPGLIVDTEPKSSSSPREKGPDEGGSTTDESDDDLQSSHSKSLPLRTGDAVASGSTNDSKGLQSEPMDMGDDGLSASASAIDRNAAETPLVPNPKSKLGKIGGKGKDSSPEAPAVLTSKPKLGKIGGKGKLGRVGGIGSISIQNEDAASNKSEEPVNPECEASDQTAATKILEPETRGRTVQRPLEPSPPRETSQERANRKREQLKRELESKSQAAAKKKRRF